MNAYLKAEIAEIDGRAIMVHAGDAVGASPPESALMQDEPTIQFLNMMANAEDSMKQGIDHLVNVMTAASAPPFSVTLGASSAFSLVLEDEHAARARLREIAAKAIAKIGVFALITTRTIAQRVEIDRDSR